MFSRQAAASGNTAAIRSSASIRCSCGAHLAAAAAARHRQRDRRVPAPPRLEHRRVEKRLDEHVARRRRMQIAEHVGQRERVLRTERQQQRVFGGRRLQLEVELAAEALAQRQPPRLVDAAAERRVQHELHAARFVEEPLEHQRLLRRQRRRARAAPRRGRRRPVRPPRVGMPVSAHSQSIARSDVRSGSAGSLRRSARRGASTSLDLVRADR